MKSYLVMQAGRTSEARMDLFNAWSPDRILELVVGKDRAKILPYIEDEMKAAKQLGPGASDYIKELERLKTIIEEETN